MVLFVAACLVLLSLHLAANAVVHAQEPSPLAAPLHAEASLGDSPGESSSDSPSDSLSGAPSDAPSVFRNETAPDTAPALLIAHHVEFVAQTTERVQLKATNPKNSLYLTEDEDHFEALELRGANFSFITTRLHKQDTGRLLTVPLSHFALQQPAPALNNYDPNLALALAAADAKYFYECGADAKRDFRFVRPEECLIDNLAEKPEGYEPPPVVHDLDVVHEALTGILRSWSAFSEQHKIAWWISHGEMLGWFWNGRMMPWDADLDIQMSTYQLIQLAVHNQTLMEGRFLIDVNPSTLYRTPQAMNTIDARVVDTKTGYLMDITGLTHIPQTTESGWPTDETVVSCKSPHDYEYDDLMPLHETMLDGIRVWRPRAVMKILKEEYSENALVNQRYRVGVRKETFGWDEGRRLWVPVVEEVEEEGKGVEVDVPMMPGDESV
ncbi:hypothetical protein HDU98_011663 [Podochytrium sp. JEL0797]|nr:hypothetical protein HDU98_011663 [Podochytrium sp. JEL0797]